MIDKAILGSVVPVLSLAIPTFSPHFPSVAAMDHDMAMPMPDHGGEHSDHTMQCSMSMLFNTSTKGLCVVFSSWKVNSTTSLAFTLLALFSLAMLLEYLRLSIRSYDAHLITSYNLTNGVLAALGGNSPSHRRKASVQQKRSISSSGGIIGSGGALLSSSTLKPSIGERRATPSDGTSGSWTASDDDAPLLPGPNDVRRHKVPLLTSVRQGLIAPLPVPRRIQIRRTALYVSSVALGMFLMLVFMTYNAWLILAVLGGAAAGHYLFGRDLNLGRLGEEKGMSCH